MISKSSLFCFFLVCILVGGTDSSKHQTHKTYMTYVDRVMIAFKKVIGFFSANYRDVNLDGVSGLRYGEGALKKALEEAKLGIIDIDAGIKTKIMVLKHEANAAAEKAIPYLKCESPAYFKQFKKTVVAPWPIFKPFQKLNHTEIPMPSSQNKKFAKYYENNSNKCLSEITGTQKGSNSSKRCTISDECWQMETRGKTHGYALTHQGLYFLFGEAQGCKKEISERLRQSNIKGGINKVYSRMCASMYPQMTHIEKKKNDGLHSDIVHRDLYMEQAMVCATMGFSDFLSIKRLHDILSWQMDNGCFGSLEELKNQRLQKIVNDEAQSLKRTHEERDKLRQSRKLMSQMTMRKILEEKELKDGCESHITGVATGLLGVYLRWLLYSASTEKKFGDPVFAQEQTATKVLEGPLKKKRTSNLSWNVVILITAVLLWLATLRLNLLRRLCLRIAARSAKSYFKV